MRGENKALLVRVQRRAYDAAVAQVLKKNAVSRGCQLVLDSARLETTRMNRRRCIRYPLRSFAVFQWQGRDGVQKHAKGWTRDVSEAGAYVVSSQCPTEGEAIQLVLKFPVRPAPSSGTITAIDMNGNVLRVDRDPVHGRELGFAVRRREAGPNLEFDGFENRPEGRPEVRLKPLQTN